MVEAKQDKKWAKQKFEQNAQAKSDEIKLGQAKCIAWPNCLDIFGEFT